MVLGIHLGSSSYLGAFFGTLSVIIALQIVPLYPLK
jgi:hypothetical protein